MLRGNDMHLAPEGGRSAGVGGWSDLVQFILAVDVYDEAVHSVGHHLFHFLFDGLRKCVYYHLEGKI